MLINEIFIFSSKLYAAPLIKISCQIAFYMLNNLSSLISNELNFYDI